MAVQTDGHLLPDDIRRLRCSIDHVHGSLQNLCQHEDCTIDVAIIVAWIAVQYHMLGAATVTTAICHVPLAVEEGDHPCQDCFALETDLHQSLDLPSALSMVDDSIENRKVHFKCRKSIQEEAPSSVVVLYSGPERDEDIAYLMKHSSIALSINRNEITVSTNLWCKSETLRDGTAQTYSTLLETALTNMVKANIPSIQRLVRIGIQQATPFKFEAVEYVPNHNETINRLMKRIFLASPSALAVLAWDGAFTYRDLDEQSRCLAKELQRLGYPKGSPVIQCLRHSRWAIVACLGILRSGLVCVPLDADSTARQAKEMIEATKARIAICDDAKTSQIRPWMEQILTPDKRCLDDDEELDDHVDPADLAFIMYTSGSTGQPKGVIQEHGALCEGFANVANVLELNENTRYLQFSSYSFDASLGEIFPPLLASGCVVIPSEDTRLGDLATFMTEYKITDACLTPTVAMTISPKMVPWLKQLSLGGERAPRALVELWAEHVRLNIIYGTTETGVWDSIASNISKTANPSCIGEPIACKLWITHANNPDSLTPIGVTGELCIQGTTLARGYLNMEDITSAKFLATTAWVTENGILNGGTIYRTGDLARFDEKGRLILLGRHDRQIKIRGQKVDVEKIENHLSESFPEKHDVAVDLFTQGTSQELVLYLSNGDSGRVEVLDCGTSEAALRQLGEVFPTYMVPSFCITLSSFPRTRTGKTDRKRLHAIASEVDRSRWDHFACKVNETKLIPQDRQSRVIGKLIWDFIAVRNDEIKRSLQNRDISLREVGINSIQAVSLRKRLREKTGVDVPASTLLFRDTRISDVIRYVNDSDRGWSRKDSSSHFRENLSFWSGRLQRLFSLRVRKVFLTGATGFLGSQILRQLFDKAGIEKVVVLVRANDHNSAMAKIRNSGSLGRWWNPSYEARIDIVLGDMTQKRLGLGADDWVRLFGDQSMAPEIHTVIHNGAVVDWSANFNSLEQANVTSTYEILSAIVGSRPPLRLTYISGGYLSVAEESEEDLVRRISDLSGYDQTKFVSASLVQQYNLTLLGDELNRPLANVINPGFIIGTRTEGVSQPEDALWRLLKACATLGSYSSTDAKSWVTVVGADTAASIILERALETSDNVAASKTTKLLDGIVFEEFWTALRDHGITASPMEHGQWLQEMLSDLDDRTEEHPLYPLEEWFRNSGGRIGGDAPLKSQLLVSPSETKSAVKSSVNYMVQSGYFQAGTDATTIHGKFSRTR